MEIKTSNCEVESIRTNMQEPNEVNSEDNVDVNDHIDGYGCVDLSIECSLDNERQHLQYFINNGSHKNDNNKNIDNDDDDDDDDDDDNDDDDDDDDDDDKDDDNDGDDEEEQLTNYSDVDLPSDSNKHLNVMNYDGRFSRRKKKKKKDDEIDRVVSESESERFSIPRSSPVSIERFSIRANYNSSDSSRATSLSNDKFYFDFSLPVASASSGDCISIPTSDPFSVRNLDFAASAFSLGRVNSYSEKFSDIYSTKNSDFSTRNSTDFRTTQSEEERFSDDSLEEASPSITTTLNTPVISSSSTTTAAAGTASTILFSPFHSVSTVAQQNIQVSKRHSIAWEVPFEHNSLFTPGCTKVVGRRRRRSSDVSSISSTYKLHDFDYDWREHENYRHEISDNDNTQSVPDSTVFSINVEIDAKNTTNNSINNNNDDSFNELMFEQDLMMKNDDTYIVRGHTRKKKDISKCYSNTFADIKSLLREGKLQGLHDPPPDFVPSPVPPPDLIRFSSLPIFYHKQIKELKPDCHEDATSESLNNIKLKHDEQKSVVVPASTAISTSVFTTITTTTTTITTTLHSSSSSSLSTILALSNDKNKKCQKSKYSECANVTSHSLPISNSGIINVSNSIYSNKILSLQLTENQFESCNLTKLANPAITVDCNNQSKIPVTVLIEDQIVKKALNENRRQLERVSDALKELETVRSNDTHSLKNEQERTEDNKDMFDFDINNSNKILHNDNTNPDINYRYGKSNDTFHQYLLTSADVKNYSNQVTENLTTSKLHAVEEVVNSEPKHSSNSRFQIDAEMIEFPPLPPSPVEEADEENLDMINSGYSNVISSLHKNSSHNLPLSVSSIQHIQSGRTTEYRPQVPPHRIPLSSITNIKDDRPSLNSSRKNEVLIEHVNNNISKKTISSRHDSIPNEKCTSSTDLPGPSSGVRSKKRVSTKSSLAESTIDNVMPDKKYTPSKINSGMQTSCSLPETPVFARGCDTNPRILQYVTTASSTLSIVATTTTTTTTNTTPIAMKITPVTSEAVISQIRRQPSWYGPTISTTGGYRRNNPNLEEALIGTELLRLAGGPNRGWYPTRRSTTNQPRPASIEHLERLNTPYGSRFSNTAYSGDFFQRKPLTLPTNITPNKFFGHQSKHSTVTSGTREALRRVTSLLIKKGVGVKGENKNAGPGKDGHSSGSSFYSGCDTASSNDGSRKKGFFKSFWKRSRHYSLENQ